MKRALAILLALVLVLNCLPTSIFAVGFGNKIGTGIGGPLSLPANSGSESGFAFGKDSTQGNLSKYEPSGTPFSQQQDISGYKAGDEVTFIVVVNSKSLLDMYSVSEIADQSAAVQDTTQLQEEMVDVVKTLAQEALDEEDVEYELGYDYSIATTGFSVTTDYANMERLSELPGVESVYVAPTFYLPEDVQNLSYTPYTNNASTMIGADTLNKSGYTGKGMRIAILDTGILVDHPNFAALPDEVLVNPMTRQEVDDIWDTLQASKLTNRLNQSYKNTKIPYAFNYASGDFDVSNTYAGSDHGTHVAGIAAANKIDNSTVVGVAPDAQLVVMQVFQQGGGAGWATILAALEDCVMLKVDSVNLSLGAGAGFTDTPDMLEVMKKFQNSDIQLLIASGNDTNNAYGNAWGLNMSLISNPDTGLVGTPATYSAALAVASVDNDGYNQLYITVDGVDYGYQDTAITTATNFQANFRDKELEYVIVPGYGMEEDYEGIDVTGKIAVISRGESSFLDKQATAQAHGAIGCVIYNNALGFINMQINDGEGNIPCVSVSLKAGEALIAGSGKIKVCNGDTKLFKLDQTISSFSSWGVTPDLKLKPEISGVGGNIYSCTDPAISRSYYDYMSGTSMATPQITGAMAVLIEYLNANYPEYTGAQLRQVAANILMSTADPVLATTTLEYSPRAQGAGLANLVSATTTPAYLANRDASEGRPKVEMGDDDSKSGVYSFSFQIHNLKDQALTYTLSSNLITESIYENNFIAAAPYGLEAKVNFVGGNTVTVPAGGSVDVNCTITLTDADHAYLRQFPNGMFVEGYIYATPATEAEGISPVRLTMPVMGFYGDWSAADVFDSEDETAYSLYPVMIYTNYAQLGTNPYIRTGKSGDIYNAFSYSNPLVEIDFGMLRNARRLCITVTNTATGEEYYREDYSYVTKSFYNASYGMIIPAYLEYSELWDGTDMNGNELADGTKVTFRMDAYLDDGDTILDDSIVFDMTLDSIKPQVLNADDLQSAITTENGRNYLTLNLQDNAYIAAVLFESTTGAIMGKFDVDNEPGKAQSYTFDITGFGNEFSIIVADYACNETTVDALLALEDNDKPDAMTLSKDRIYGCETFTQAQVEPGWFSANIADLSDPRNETYDSSNRYYAAEYVNGYLIAQNANTGYLELVTPSGTYWKTQTLATQHGSVGDAGVWVLYDMALDYSGKYAAAVDPYQSTNGTDTLFAVGWAYKGDQDNDGHDDGYNALFRIWTSKWNGQWFVEEVAQIESPDGQTEMLTLGITTEGDMYAIGTNGALYALNVEIGTNSWNEPIVEKVTTSYIGTTPFVEETNYSGVNVIQSMGYDHNTDTMYWFAHSQTLLGYSYVNVNVTYKVNLQTGDCERIGSYGPGGQTSLFVPTDLESDLFTMGVNPNSFQLDAYKVTMVAGQNRKLSVAWTPWNCKPTDVTWSSDDETVATVDANGIVTALTAGKATITATARVYDPYADYDYETYQPIGAWVDRTVSCEITVVESQDSIYGFILEDFANIGNRFTWFTYADNNPGTITRLGSKVTVEVPDLDGNYSTTDAIWQGGAYYNGYLYTIMAQGRGGVGASVLYRSKVTKGETPSRTVIGKPEEIGYTTGIELGNMAFDYNTGRMYAVDLTYGGLAILDLETGAIDPLGTFSGDIGGPAIAPAMTVTADGTIIISSMYGELFSVDADTLETHRLGALPDDADSWYYASMMYDYNTGNIYWNPCMASGLSSLYLVTLGTNDWSGALEADVMKLGNVSSKQGVEQTVMFTIPEVEPETHYIPVESLTITNGDSVTGLVGGEFQLNTSTTPDRPSTQVKVWSSSDESVVTVDQFGKLTYTGVGTATVTATISKNTIDGKPITASISVTVLEAAGRMDAFLCDDVNGTQYYDFWISMNDYDLRHAAAGNSMINVLSLRCGTYYDGYFYAYTNAGLLVRIDPNNTTAYSTIGSCGLDYAYQQMSAMTVDYNTGIVYGLTMPTTFNYSTYSEAIEAARLVTVDLNTGAITTVATLDINRPVFALAADKDGTLYAAGSPDAYSDAVLYTVDKTTGALTEVTTIEGTRVYTGSTYYGEVQYNSQMTYDFGTNRLYLNATAKSKWDAAASGMYLIQLGGETPACYNLGGISLYTRAGSTIKYGDVYLGLLSMIPEADELPQTEATGISIDKSIYRLGVGSSVDMNARTRPANALDPTLTYTSADASIATVSADGVITGVAVGKTTVTITTANGLTAVCDVIVMDNSKAASTAYTVTPDGDKLISFNPQLPYETTAVIADFPGAGKVAGLAYGDDCLYYLAESSYSYYLYRYDFATGQSVSLGYCSNVFTGAVDMAYDKDNNLLYIVGGYYLYQYDLSKATGEYIPQAGYLQDSAYSTMAGVAVVDGAIYLAATSWELVPQPQLIRYSDKYLSDRTVVAEGFDINIGKEVTEMDYDASTGLLYLTDGMNRIYSIKPDGTEATLIDTLKGGIELRGLAIDSTLSYTVIYTDGVEGEEIFADQHFAAAADKATPAFRGTPTRKGYTFTGWTPTVAEIVTGNVTYTATWSVNSYTVSFDGRGGEVNGKPITVTYNTAIGTLPVPTRDGYTFAGWIDLDGNVYTAETIYTVDSDLTLYAKWEANTYTVTLDPNGGELKAEPITVTFGREIGELPEPTRDGYTFIGWFDENGEKVLPGSTYQIASDSVLTARWSQYAFTVTLDPNGGTVNPTTVRVEMDAPVGTLPVPTRNGYTFIGWFDADGNEYTAETIFAAEADITLTARWEANTYTVTLDDGTEKTTITVTFGQPIGELPVPTKNGHTFGGWFDADGNEYTAETLFAAEADITLTARWEANTYTVTLDDGTEKTTITVTFGQPIGELPTPTRDGHTFDGWYDENGEKVTEDTVVTRDMTVTAKWEAISTSPGTGDSFQPMILAAMLASLAAALWMVLNDRRRKHC